MIEVSIIIPVRNQKQSLLAALESLRKQIDRPRSFEIVICDDGSIDGCEQAIKKLRYPIYFKYIRNSVPLGRSANRNLGAERSSGRLMIFFDGDMVPDSRYVESILNGMDESTVKLGEVKPPPGQKTSGFERYLYSRGRHRKDGSQTEIPGRMFTSNNFAIERSLFLKSGGFDRNFKAWGGEDIDFGIRLVSSGARLIFDSNAVTYHHHRRTLDDVCRQFREFGMYSIGYLIKKHPQFVRDLPADILNQKKKGLISRVCWGLLLSVATNSLFLRAAALKVKTFSIVPWPDLIYDYLLWGNVACGYRRRRKDRAGDEWKDNEK